MARPHAGIKLPFFIDCYVTNSLSLLHMVLTYTGLSQMCVLPSHQRRGIGSMLMRIDQQGLESFIEATDAGQKLYEKFGYGKVKRVEVDMSHVSVADEETNEWQHLRRNLLLVGYVALWSPRGGVQDDEEFEGTWRERLSL